MGTATSNPLGSWETSTPPFTDQWGVVDTYGVVEDPYPSSEGGESAILMESGSYLLLESGDTLLLE